MVLGETLEDNYNTNGHTIMEVNGHSVDSDIGDAGGAPTSSLEGSGHSGIGFEMVIKSRGCLGMRAD